MSRNPFRAMAIMACLILISAAAYPAACQPTGKVEVTTVHSQSNTSAIPIAAKAGSQFTIKLDANHTTGYKWQLAGTPNAKEVKLVGSTYAESTSGLAGRGGKEVWTFQAVSKGAATLTLNYVRTWEKNVAPAKVQRFEVTVK